MYLTCIGDSTNLATWSGIPYFLLRAGLDSGMLEGGLPLQPKALNSSKLIWNATRPLLGSMPGGFQYTSQFANKLLSQACLPVNAKLLSLQPMLPAWPWPESWQVFYYIDMTTRQVFDFYKVGNKLSSSVRNRALEQDRSAFQQSLAIVCMCQWAAESVINDYGIDSAKVHVVPGGANLDEALLVKLPSAATPPPPSAKQPLRLGFLGKEWQRKGGGFLLELADALQQRSIPTVIRAIGPNPVDLPAHPALQPLGFINKQTNTARFVSEVQSWHFGTLFSEAEAFGISNRECLRLGVPVLCHAVGGIASTLPDAGCGQLFAPHPSAAEVADWISARLNPYAAYLAWRAALVPRWWEFTWEAAAKQLARIVHPS